MRILAVESSGPLGSVALLNSENCVLELQHDVPNLHAETLPRYMERALVEAGWQRSQLDAVAVGVGPGSFTGLRVGIALAQGVATGLDKPLLGVSSLRALAAAAREAAPHASWFAAAVDAHREEYFVTLYRPDLSEHLPARALHRERFVSDFAALLSAAGLDGQLGYFAGKYPAGLEARTDIARLETVTAPSARFVGLLAARGQVEADAMPQYLRPADAVIPNIVPHPLLSQLAP